MGDMSDMNDLDRVMRSSEGMARLDAIRAELVGRTIVGVDFSNGVRAISVTLRLDDGGAFEAPDPSLEVDVLRDEFASVIRREYLERVAAEHAEQA